MLDNLNLAIVMCDTHMAQDLLPDLLAGAHGFDGLNAGVRLSLVWKSMFCANEHVANHNRGLAWNQFFDRSVLKSLVSPFFLPYQTNRFRYRLQ